MKKLCVMGVTVVLLMGVWAGVGSAPRSGGPLNFMGPYGGDLLGLDPHKSTRVQDFLVMSNINDRLRQRDRTAHHGEPQRGDAARRLAWRVEHSSA